jgi:hypothetical protein
LEFPKYVKNLTSPSTSVDCAATAAAAAADAAGAAAAA